jgi:hypothetical protein
VTTFLIELEKRLEQIRGEFEGARQRAVEAAGVADTLRSQLSAYEQIYATELQRAGQHGPIAPPAAQPVLSPDFGGEGRVNKTDIAFHLISAKGPNGASVDDLEAGFKARGLVLHRNYLFNIASRLKQQGRIEQRAGRYFVKAA